MAQAESEGLRNDEEDQEEKRESDDERPSPVRRLPCLAMLVGGGKSIRLARNQRGKRPSHRCPRRSDSPPRAGARVKLRGRRRAHAGGQVPAAAGDGTQAPPRLCFPHTPSSQRQHHRPSSSLAQLGFITPMLQQGKTTYLSASA